MQSLKDVIASLCAEIDDALVASQPQVQGRRLESDRVVLSLQVAIREQTTADGKTHPVFEVVSSGEQGPDGSGATTQDHRSHQVTVELKPGDRTVAGAQSDLEPVSGASETKADPVTQAPANISEDEAEQVVESLSEIFGAPGFDSSARATVFREALTGLSDDQVRTVIDSLDKNPPPQIDDVLHQARHMIYNILSSGPTESVTAGNQRLAPLFHKYSVGSLLRLIEERWKTQTDWLDS